MDSVEPGPRMNAFLTVATPAAPSPDTILVADGRNGAWADHDVVGQLVPIVPDGGAPIDRTYVGVDDPGCSDATRDCAFYDGSFTVAGEGEHQVTWFSTDATGAAEAAHHETIRIDKTAPVTAASVETAGDGTKVTLTATDARSGVVETDYDLDGAGFKPYGEPVLVTGAGDHTLRFRSVDHAGNFETPQTVSVRVAAPQPPAFTSKATASPSRIKRADGRLVAIKVAIDASAKPSRVRLLEVRHLNAKGAAVDGWKLGTADLTGSVRAVAGAHYSFRYEVTDASGHRATSWTAVDVAR
jgi:hypothetical protein